MTDGMTQHREAPPAGYYTFVLFSREYLKSLEARGVKECWIYDGYIWISGGTAHKKG
jgi:hypothetical protein